jgi:hypothetical protein
MLPLIYLFIGYLLVKKVIKPATVMDSVDTRQLVISPSIIEVRQGVHLPKIECCELDQAQLTQTVK